MTYTEFISKQLAEYNVGQPIYTRDISKKLASTYEIPPKEASAAVAVVFKRVMSNTVFPNLRFYQNGIYYFTAVTPFGEIGINKEQLIADKYLLPNKGYETGFTVLHRIGLTTQLPKERCIATNRVTGSVRMDKKLNVLIRPPKARVTESNKLYLQFLDVLDIMENAPVDAERPYELLGKYAKQIGLKYEYLLALADRYYTKKTIVELAHTASEGGIL